MRLLTSATDISGDFAQSSRAQKRACNRGLKIEKWEGRGLKIESGEGEGEREN